MGQILTEWIMKEASAAGLPPGDFLSPASQIAVFCDWNKSLRKPYKPFSKREFEKLGRPPAVPEGRPDVQVVLEPTFDTVQLTFDLAWRCLRQTRRDSRIDPDIFSSPKHLRLLCGVMHRRGLRWRVIDFGANVDAEGIHVTDVWDPNKSPSSAILWALAFSPGWFEGRKLWIPGYQVFPPAAPELLHAITLSQDLCADAFMLQARQPTINVYPDFAIPEFVEI